MKTYAPKQSRYLKNFKKMLVELDQEFGDQVAVTTFDRKGRSTQKTYKDVKNDALAFGRALYGKGLKGSHVGIVSENSYEWLVAYFGTTASGSTAVCIDIDHNDDLIREMLMQADVNVVVVSEDLQEICVPLLTENKIKELIVIGEPDEGGISLEEFVEQWDIDEAQTWMEEYEPSAEDIASIVYTSGTTSTAKPVMLSQQSILYNAADSLTLLDSRDRVYNSLPLYHTYGLTCGILCPFLRGLNVGICVDVKRLLQDLALFKPGMLVAVPLIIEVVHKIFWGLIEKNGKKAKIVRMMKLETGVFKPGTFISNDIREIIKGSPVENLDVILSGGAYLAHNVAEDLLHFGAVTLQGYGITECCPSISCNRNEDFSIDSVGVPLPGFTVRFVDDEIRVKGYSIMSGYYNAPELTAKAFDEEGWFCTGDVGYMDKKGHLHITGRMKNLIVMKNGKKVAAEEMENAIMNMPLVKEVLVYGAQCGNSADDVKLAAAIYPDPEKTAGMNSYEILEKLQAYINEMNSNMPLYKQIQMVNIQEKAFERTSSKKIKRN